MKHTQAIRSIVSASGLAVIAVGLLLAVALISQLPGWRLDLTEDRLYSLSDGTRNIVSGLERPMELMLFYSDSLTGDQPQIRGYANRVQELLEEMVIASGGNLSLAVIDPQPFSEEEDLAASYGVRATPLGPAGQPIYFGLVASQRGADLGQATEDGQQPQFTPPVVGTLPLIRPDQERYLEYEVMKLIVRTVQPGRPVVGLLSSLQIDGGIDADSAEPLQPWMIMDMIRQLYEVRQIDTSAEQIPEDIDILLLVHPEGLSARTLYAIDQHVMRGGKAMVFIDPSADSLVTRTYQGTLIPAGVASDLPGLLEAWGVAYDSSQVIADSRLALNVMIGQQASQPVTHLAMLGVARDYLAADDIVTEGLENINMAYVGALSPLPDSTTRFEPLLWSSADAMLMDTSRLENLVDPLVLFDGFVPGGQNNVMAARLSGVFTTAFPDGQPPAEQAADDSAAVESTDGAANGTANDGADSDSADTADPVADDSDSATDSGNETELLPHRAQTDGEVNIVIFADTDILTDGLWVQVAQFLGQRIPQPFAGNGDLIINTLDNLSGGADLVGIRSRGRYSRPFTRVLALQRAADDRLRQEEAELEQRKTETEAQLSQLLNYDGGDEITITPEMQAEIDRFSAELLDTRRRLREVQYQLTEDVQRLGNTLKWLNTLAVPTLLTALILLWNWHRRRRQ